VFSRSDLSDLKDPTLDEISEIRDSLCLLSGADSVRGLGTRVKFLVCTALMSSDSLISMKPFWNKMFIESSSDSDI